MKKNQAAVVLGRIKSKAKAEAARKNGLLGGRPRSDEPRIFVVLSNDFHNTEVRVRGILRDNRIKLTKSQVARIYYELCGVESCYCGTVRGDQLQTNGTVARFEDDFEGNGYIYLDSAS